MPKVNNNLKNQDIVVGSLIYDTIDDEIGIIIYAASNELVEIAWNQSGCILHSRDKCDLFGERFERCT